MLGSLNFLVELKSDCVVMKSSVDDLECVLVMDCLRGGEIVVGGYF